MECHWSRLSQALQRQDRIIEAGHLLGEISIYGFMGMLPSLKPTANILEVNLRIIHCYSVFMKDLRYVSTYLLLWKN